MERRELVHRVPLLDMIDDIIWDPHERAAVQIALRYLRRGFSEDDAARKSWVACREYDIDWRRVLDHYYKILGYRDNQDFFGRRQTYQYWMLEEIERQATQHIREIAAG